MKRFIIYGLSLAAAALLAVIIALWFIAFRPNVERSSEHGVIVPNGTSFNDLKEILRSTNVLINKNTFVLASKLKRFDRSIKPGYYLIRPGMNNNQIINNIRSGRQTPVNVTFNNIRTLNDLAGKIGGQIEADSAEIITFLSDEANYRSDGFNHSTVISVFIPDTYQFYWTTDAYGFYKRMLREYNAFWNEERIAAAKNNNLTPVEVSILASIVDDEVVKKDEKPRIAGVYLNRLRMGIPLQACPTIKFALNDFTIRRVLYEHLSVESPYNTYKYKGLPPGPIRCPERSGIDAVLHAEKHDYLYFEAKADFSQTHHFSRTLAEHNKYANEYQRELDKRKIYD